MSEMIERVAQAILQEQQTNRSAFPDTRDLARAAIEEMRRPTEAMITAGERHTDSYYSEDGDFMQGWQAAFNEALGETP